MKNRKKIVSFVAGVMALVILLTLILGLLPTSASAASSSEIRKQINALKAEKEEISKQITLVQEQYEENEDEIADIIARKNVIDQEIQLLSTQITNIHEQIASYNLLIADKQDELDNAQLRYENMNQENKDRIRAMEEEGELSYWEVLFKANSFSDLLDRLNMVEEIAASDNRRLQELGEAAEAVEVAREDLEAEKAELVLTQQELDDTQVEMDEKRAEADQLFQELLTKADDLEALEAEFEAMEEAFLKEIAQKEVEFSAAKQAEWAAYMATYVPPEGSGNTGASAGGTGGTASSSGWLIPCNYSSITSPFGNRTAPTAGASSNHMGIDLDSTTGTTVIASRPGTVVAAGYTNAAGNYVKIDHGDGYTSIYMHLNNYNVSAGQIVGGGQSIGAVGATGVATGDHLHFGITKNGVYVNPSEYLF